MEQKGIKFTALLLLFVVCDLKAQSGSQMVEKDIQLFSEYLSTNSDSAHHLIQRAYKKSLALGNDSLIARSSYNIGYYNYLKKNFIESKRYLDQSLAYAHKTKYHKISALCYNQLGSIKFDENQFEEALKLYLKAYEIANKNNLPESKSRILINLGNLYLRQKDTIRSLNYYNENIRIAQENSLDNELLKGYMNVAVLFSGKEVRKSVRYYTKALAIAKKSNDLYSEFNLHINLSELYLNGKKESDLDAVLDHLSQAKKKYQILKDDSLLFYLNFNFGGYFRKKKQYDNALRYYKSALQLSEKNVTSDQVLNLYEAISEIYSLKGDYKNALSFKNKQYRLWDSIFTEKKNNYFAEIQTKYEVDKKNLKIQLLTQEKIIEQGSRKLIFIAGAIIIGCLLLAIFFYKNRIKIQKIISAKENEIHKQEIIRLEQEKELKRIIGLIQGQDQERNRVAREIHDGIGGALAGIKLELSQYNSELKSSKIETILDKMSFAFTNLRLISHNLSINYMKDKELENLLTGLKEEYENRGEFKVRIAVYPKGSLNQSKEIIKHHIYRVIQELLNNVSKHAKADVVFLSITKHDDFLNVMLEDDGCGFDSNTKNGVGLNNVIERLAAIETVFNIESRIGRGTIITFDIPVSQL